MPWTLLANADESLSHTEVMHFFLSVAVLLGAARLMGELARRLNQPAVLGEIFAGIILGPTLLGKVLPNVHEYVFPEDPRLILVADGLRTLAIALFLLVAGMEVDLSKVWKQGRSALAVIFAGIVVPFAIAFVCAAAFPNLLGISDGAKPMVFALFFATALSISALPVIAKTMMDLDLYRTDMGMIVITAAILDDLGGWIIFAVLLGMMGAAEHDGGGASTLETVLLTLGYTAVVLTLGRWIIHRSLPYIQAHLTWPGGVIGFALALALLGAAFTQWIGVHAIFGAFIIGVAVGDSSHLREQTRSTIHQFVSFFFAPLFFASIGLRLDFVSLFDPVLVALVLVIACAGKILGCGLAARWTGMPKREAWAVGFGMNARGAMEIVLGLLALHAGLISERLFVALVIMALATSIMSGPIMQRLLRRNKTVRFSDFIPAKLFLPRLKATSRTAAIRELAEAAAAAQRLDADTVTRQVMHREAAMGSGLVNGIAIPHARLQELETPLIAAGLSQDGIDFDSADGKPAHLVFLILTPQGDLGSQLQVLANIAETFRGTEVYKRFLNVGSHAEFLAKLKSDVPKEEGAV